LVILANIGLIGLGWWEWRQLRAAQRRLEVRALQVERLGETFLLQLHYGKRWLEHISGCPFCQHSVFCPQGSELLWSLNEAAAGRTASHP
jgi:hypothetical protein